MSLFKLKVFARSLVGERAWSVVQGLSTAPRHRLVRLCKSLTNQTVQSGPFKGMIYRDDVSGGYIPKVLGIYERELHPIVNKLPELGIRRVVNVGAADGYYAVGLCRMIPELEILAFETHPRGQDRIRGMSRENGVESQISVAGHCYAADLSNALADSKPTLVLCDVEGFEDVLIDPKAVPALTKAWILVEIHDGKNPNVSERIRERFEGTHQIETIWQEKRTPADFPYSNEYTKSLAAGLLVTSIDEGRPVKEGITPMSWFWMTPKSR